MVTELICPGKSNPYPRSVHFEYYGESLYLVYASGSRLIISTWDNKLVQVLEFSDHTEEITSVSLSKYNGKIAIGLEKSVKVYIPLMVNSESLKWDFDSTIEYECPVTGVSWFKEDELLISGITLSTWKYSNQEWLCSWKERSTHEVYIAEISPDHQWVASTHKHDCYIKTWPLNQVSTPPTSQTYGYLRHPSPVFNFGWQQHPSKNDLQILFSACTDGIFRVWAPSNPKQPEQFYLCCAVEPGPLATNPDCTDDLHSPKLETLQRIEDHELYHSAPFHWIDGSTVRELTMKEIFRCKSDFAGHNSPSFDASKLSHLEDIISDPPTLLFQVQIDGSLSLWRLDGMNEFPFAAPRAMAIARIPNAVHSREYSSFFGTCYVALCPVSESIQESPIEFSILAQNADLEIDHYTIGLCQALFAEQRGGEFKLRNTWTGHSSKVLRMIPSPIKKNCYKSQLRSTVTFPRVATLTDRGEVGVWEMNYSPERVKPLYQADMILQDEEIIQDLAWLNPEYLVIIERSRCYLYHVLGGSFNSGQVILLNSNHTLSDLKRVTVIPDSNQEKFGVFVEDQFTNFHQWIVTLGESNVPEIRHHSDGKLPIEPKLTSDWLINSLSYPRQEFLVDDLFYLVSTEGTNLQFWKSDSTKLQSDSFKWTKALDYSTKHYSIATLCCGPENLILLTSVQSNITIISIVDTRLISFGHIKEYEVEWCGEEIMATSWLYSNLGNPVLGIASKSCVSFFSQDTLSDTKKWILRACTSLDSPSNKFTDFDLSSISSLSFTSDGSIFCSVGKFVICRGKWLPELDLTVKCDIRKEEFPIPTLHSICQSLRPSTSHIHPRHLFELIKWGDVTLVNTILSFLEDMITHQDLISDSALIIIPPMSLDSFLFKKVEKESGSKLDALFSSINEQHSTLSDFQISTMCEALAKCPIEGLHSDAQKVLISFIETFYKVKPMQNSVDKFGFRFILDIQLQAISDRMKLTSTPVEIDYATLNTYSFLYAFHSNSQDILLSNCLSEYKDTPQKKGSSVWSELSRLGIAYWLRDDDALRREAENLARVQFLKNKDPVECSLIYLALNKKRLLLSLWKTATYHSEYDVMVKFLSNDFTLARWKTAAKKNAFKLIGRQRYEYAIAFFILAGELKDALSIALRYLKSPTLALFICRCYQGIHGEESQRLLQENLLTSSMKSGDRGLLSIVLWWLEEKKLAIQTLSLPFEKLVKLLKEKYPEQEMECSEPCLTAFKDFKNIAINIRQETATTEATDQGKLLIDTAKHYEELGMPLLSIYSLSCFTIKEEDSPTMKKDIFATESADSSHHVISQDNSQSAISSGQFDFDDWSWGTTTRKITNTKLFDIPETKEVVSSQSIDLPSHQYHSIRGYTYKLLHLMHREVEESLRLAQYPGRLPKTIIFDYLDKVKIGIQKIHEFFDFNEQAFDMSLVRWCFDSDKALFGFDLLYQGILSQEINGQQFAYSLISNCVFLSTIILNDHESTFCSTEAALLWIQTAFRDFGRWSVALRLASDSAQATSQTQVLILFFCLLYLLYLMKSRDYENLFSLLKHWKQMIKVLEEDLMSAQPVIKLIMEVSKGSAMHQNSDGDWNLDFEVGDDLKIVYSDKDKETQGSWADIEGGCESLFQEATLFKEIISYVLPSIKHFLTEYNHDSSLAYQLPPLTATLLEPLFLIHKELETILNQIRMEEGSLSQDNSIQLPRAFQIDPDQVFDSYLQITYFLHIRKFIQSPEK